MMKKILVPVAVVGLLAACQPPAGGSKELTERIEKLEKKVAAARERNAELELQLKGAKARVQKLVAAVEPRR